MNNRFRKLIRKNMLLSWMLSYILMLAIPLSTYSLATTFAKRALEQEVQENNAKMVEQMAQSFDYSLQSVIQFRDYLWQDQGLSSLLPLRFPLDAQMRYDMWQTSNNINRQIVLNSMITDGYVYLHQNNTALCRGSIYDEDLVWQLLHKDIGDATTKDEWFELIGSYHYHDFVFLPDRDGTYQVVLLTSFPMPNYYSTLATIVLILNEAAFPTGMVRDGGLNNTTLLVIGDNGELISSTDSSITALIPSVCEQITAQGRQGSFEQSMDGVKTAVTIRPSSIGPWSYVALTPIKTMLNRINQLSRSLILSVIVSVVLGLSLAACFAFRNRTNVDSVLQKLHRLTSETVEKGGQGSFDEIDRLLDGITRHSNRMNAMVEQQRQMLLQHALERLLFSDAESDLILQEIGISFRYPAFVTAVCFFNENLDTSMSATELQGHLSESANCLTEQWRSFADIYMLPLKNRLVLLLNVPQGTMNQAMEEKMTRQVHLLQQTHFEQHRYFFVSFSSERDGLRKICDAYYESMGWVNYSLLDRPREFSIYFCHNGKESEMPLTVSALQEEMIISALSSGNEKSIRDLVEQLCAPFRRSPMSPVVVRCYMHSILSVMLRETVLNDARAFVEEELVAMENCENVLEMHDILLRIMLCGVKTAQQQEAGEQSGGLLEEMLSIIRENYTDCNFNASTMAGMMGKSLSYISKYFKDKTGVGLYDYLNRMRIEKAKELIAGSNRPISTLIDQAGFQNAGSFIRVFKRYENMTPGVYQKTQGT